MLLTVAIADLWLLENNKNDRQYFQVIIPWHKEYNHYTSVQVA